MLTDGRDEIGRRSFLRTAGSLAAAPLLLGGIATQASAQAAASGNTLAPAAPGRLDDYVVNGGYRLFKLHGSVDWSREVRTSRAERIANFVEAAMFLVENAERLTESEDIELAGTGLVNEHGVLQAPAIAIPTRRKDGFECPPKHVNILREQLPEVRAMLTIGWRAGEADFLAMLRQQIHPGVTLHCVSGSPEDSKATAEQLRSAGFAEHVPFTPYAGGSSEYVRSDECEELLGIVYPD